MLPLVLISTLMINLGYAFYYLTYFFKRGLHIAQQAAPEKVYPDYLIFSKGNGDVKIPVNEIAYVCSHGTWKAVRLHAGESRITVMTSSLKELSEMLHPDSFILVNRCYIIAGKAYVGHTNLTKGILLDLIPQPKEEVKVTTRKKDFLHWIARQDKVA